MNRLPRLALLLSLGCLLQAPHIRAQDAPQEGEEERVQYQLVRPEEKTPETVKPEEHNPFESESETQNRMSPGDTEENRVRDRLLKLPVVGTKRMTDGRMRVLLGNIILETGKLVPPVLPDQQVELKVKNITTDSIELAWQEKRATGLPPKLMIIPINISPTVRYQMLGQPDAGTGAKGTNATMEMPLRSLLAQPQDSAPVSSPPVTPPEVAADDTIRTAPPAASEEPVVAAKAAPAPAPPAPSPAAADTPPASASPAPPSPAVESVVRMLFGNPTPAPK